MNHREWRLQTYVDRFIDRVVLAPMFTTGIDHASNTTDNARARARARGLKPGVPDVWVSQGSPTRCMFIELKRGSKLSDAQHAVHKSLIECGVAVETCQSVYGVALALTANGFRLHGNAQNIAREFDARLDAAEAAPRAKSRPLSSYVQSNRKASRSRVRRITALRMETLPR